MGMLRRRIEGWCGIVGSTGGVCRESGREGGGTEGRETSLYWQRPIPESALPALSKRVPRRAED